MQKICSIFCPIYICVHLPYITSPICFLLRLCYIYTWFILIIQEINNFIQFVWNSVQIYFVYHKFLNLICHFMKSLEPVHHKEFWNIYSYKQYCSWKIDWDTKEERQAKYFLKYILKSGVKNSIMLEYFYIFETNIWVCTFKLYEFVFGLREKKKKK